MPDGHVEKGDLKELMRTKIIVAIAAIVVLLGLLGFTIVSNQVEGINTSATARAGLAKDDVLGVSGRLQLNALKTEKWLRDRALDPVLLDAFTKATPDARVDAIRVFCERLILDSKAINAFGGNASVAMIVDIHSKIIARNGTDVLRGDDLGAHYPEFRLAVQKGAGGSDIFAKTERNDQFIVSFVPVRDLGGKMLGTLILGGTLNDELSRVARLMESSGMILVNSQEEILGSSPNMAEVDRDILSKAALQTVKSSLGSGAVLSKQDGSLVFAVSPLDNLSDGKRFAIVALAPNVLTDQLKGVASSLLGLILLGLIMAGAIGTMLGSYIMRPVAELEEGLLAIINGQQYRRFNLNHAELGGLGFRIDQLLNKLMGIEEDTSDTEGRLSYSLPPPESRIDDASLAQLNSNLSDLMQETAENYHARLFAEYIELKKALGQPTSHITPAVFRERIEKMEADIFEKKGKKVRYKVQANEKEVTLLAIPLD